jgi:hypothetical protein
LTVADVLLETTVPVPQPAAIIAAASTIVMPHAGLPLVIGRPR